MVTFFTFIILCLVISVVGYVIIKIKQDQNNLGEELEYFIVSRNPKNHADIERLEFEYSQTQTRKKI